MPKIKPDYDDVFYTASLVEYIGRKTCNKRDKIVKAIGTDGIRRLINMADVNHCLSFEQVSDEVIDRYQIEIGTYDTISTCRYNVPSHLVIGSVYAKLANAVKKQPDKLPEALYEVFVSGISDAISNFNSAFYYSSSNEIEHEYRTRYNKN